MKIKCNYCECYLNDYDERCPNCGATNDNFKRTANEQPTTIEELKQWYVSHNLPPENVTRFYIGKNVQYAKAFGIYKDESGKCIVYKNKGTGERAVRYEGYDEAFAVNELYQKLKETVAIQKAGNAGNAGHAGNYGSRPGNYGGRPPVRKRPRRKSDVIGLFVFMSVVVMLILFAIILGPSQDNGYYYYDDTYYYYLDGDYYYYDDYDEAWYRYNRGTPWGDADYSEYYMNGYYYQYGVDDFTSTYYYEDWYDNQYTSDYDSGSSWDSDWDSDSSWDSSDSWDSDWGSDWDSDW